MKNIILFSTILAAGTLAANAASNIPLDLQESAVLFWNFDSGSDPNEKPTYVTLCDLFTYNESGHYGEANETNGRTWSSDFNNSAIKANAFTVSFDVSNFVADDGHCLFSMYTGASYDNNALCLKKGNTDKIYFSTSNFGGVEGNTNNSVSGLDYSTLNSSEKWTTITISSGETDTGENYFKVYSDGVLKLAIESETTDTGITYFRFCGLLGDSEEYYSTSAYFDNIAFWNVALDEDKIALLFVPEPSMFGLLAGIGALALAGTRRRRR